MTFLANPAKVLAEGASNLDDTSVPVQYNTWKAAMASMSAPSRLLSLVDVALAVLAALEPLFLREAESLPNL